MVRGLIVLIAVAGVIAWLIVTAKDRREWRRTRREARARQRDYDANGWV